MARRLSDYSEFLKVLAESFIDRFEFHSQPAFSEILREPRLLVALNHSTPLSWIPAGAALALEAIKAGGGDRTPRAVMDKWFYSNPLTKRIAEYFTQFDRPQSFDELLASFVQSERTDLVIFPEGANTFFGSVTEIGEFRSHRFVELAIRAEAPLLLVVHKGSESWSWPLQLPPEWGAFLLPFSKFFGENILKASIFNLPLIPQKLPRFQMTCELYRPALKAVEFSTDPEELEIQLRTEAEKIRRRMQEILSSMV